MENFEIVVEVLGWIASLLIVGSYGLNLWGKLSAQWESRCQKWDEMILAIAGQGKSTKTAMAAELEVK